MPGSGLLDPTDIPAPKGSAVGRSVAAIELVKGSCGESPMGAVTLTGCDPADFPWTTSPESRNQELFSRGARVLRQATYEVNAKPVLREVVMDARPGGVLVKAYRDHLQRCRVTAVAFTNGAIQQATISGGGRHLVVAFNGDDEILGLQGLAGQSAGELGRLVPMALTALRWGLGYESPLVRNDRPQLSHSSPVARALPRHHALAITDGTQWRE